MDKYYLIIPTSIFVILLLTFEHVPDEIDPWNLAILYVEVGFGVFITKVVYNRTKKSEKDVGVTLDKITNMVKDDYDLRLQRKYQIVQNLQMSLSVKKQASDFIADQMNIWLDETDESKKNEIKKEVFKAHSQIEYGYERLKEIRLTSIDVLDARISHDLELLIHCFKNKPEFDEKNNECFPDDWESASYIIEKIQTELFPILQEDPDSFESNFTCTIENKKLEDGTTAKVSVVKAKTKEDEKGESLSYLDKSLKLDPSNLMKLCHKAFVLNKEGKHSAAISYCNRVLEIDPDYLLAKINKGYALDELGLQEQAIELYDEVLEKEPENLLALLHKGIAFMMWGKLKKAIECFKKSIELDPKNIRGHQNLGFCYFHSKQYKESRDTFEKLLRLDPNHVYALQMKEQAEKHLKK